MATSHQHQEPELVAPVLLCGPDGRFNPAATGWSRYPLHTCDLPDSLARKTKWNYWAITSNGLLFSATIADMERLQMAEAYFFDRRTLKFGTRAVSCPPGTIGIPETPAGDMVIDHRALGPTSRPARPTCATR